MVDGLLSIDGLKLISPPSVGTRGDSRGATQVNALLSKKFPVVMQQGKEASVTLSGTSHCLRCVVIPLLYNGSCRIGLLALTCSPVQLGGPFGFCAFALLSPILLGSLKIALKRTRPRQRFLLCCLLGGIL